jgi:hypothetical protein
VIHDANGNPLLLVSFSTTSTLVDSHYLAILSITITILPGYYFEPIVRKRTINLLSLKSLSPQAVRRSSLHIAHSYLHQSQACYFISVIQSPSIRYFDPSSKSRRLLYQLGASGKLHNALLTLNPSSEHSRSVTSLVHI